MSIKPENYVNLFLSFDPIYDIARYERNGWKVQKVSLHAQKINAFVIHAIYVGAKNE